MRKLVGGEEKEIIKEKSLGPVSRRWIRPPPPQGWAVEPPMHQLVCALGQQFVISVSSDRVKLPSSAASISSVFTRLPSVILQEPLKRFFWGTSARMKLLKSVESSELSLSPSVPLLLSLPPVLGSAHVSTKFAWRAV